MDTIVSRFGLKAEGSLRIRVDGPTRSLVLPLMRQCDLVATLLLHALGQATDGDLSTHTEPALNQEFIRLVGAVAMFKIRFAALKLNSRVQFRKYLPCCDDVRKLRRVGGDLHCDRLKEHELLVDADGVGSGRHVLQPERSVLLADNWEDRAGGQDTA